MTRTAAPDADTLATAAEKEVAVWQTIWRGDLEQTVTLAQEVAERLSGGEELRPLRCLWLYLAAEWAASWRTRAREEGDQRCQRLFKHG